MLMGGMGAEGKPAPICFCFTLPTSCPSLLVLPGGIDGNGSLEQALLAEVSWPGPVTFRETGQGPFWWYWECPEDAEAGAAFPRKIRQGGRVGWIKKADDRR